ncbi:MAG: RNA 2',3'-cyclic phosphodiesterase [Firmicutes bacterium]|nr:RNA 2',3'-cyclic phosphodiesterase [Bacillota bacterium]
MSGESPLRLFLACPLPSSMIDACLTYIGQLKQHGWRGSYATQATLHLTLYFLGYVAVRDLEAVIASTQSRVIPTDVTVHWNTVGWFGPEQHPRVLWVGLRHVPGPLMELQQNLKAAMMHHGWGIDTARASWVPHVTLLRVHQAPRPGRLPSWTSVTTSLTQVELVHSTLTSTGPCYQTLAQFPLTTARDSD